MSKRRYHVGLLEDRCGDSQRCPECYAVCQEGDWVVSVIIDAMMFEYGVKVTCHDCGHVFICTAGFSDVELAREERRRIYDKISRTKSVRGITLIARYPEPSEAHH